MKATESYLVFDIRPFGDIPYMAFIHPIDRQRALERPESLDYVEPCTRKKTIDGYEVSELLPTDQCVHMEPAKVWRGEWVAQYEHTVFCPADAEQTQCPIPNDRIWLSGATSGEIGNRYLVSFVGRKTKYPGGYGHFGLYHSEIIVDRMISQELLSAIE
ncbi:hypothetical protein C7451_10372 [Blastomonas natatoria]|uniref:Uncharacterized protein n=2 Tax=Blastomonas natatoria TaxID=34015 RepID=A0A2V3V8G4_9SPHN|nr:hypothetical protein C7451_10372 [Blastomonas natatoria]